MEQQLAELFAGTFFMELRRRASKVLRIQNKMSNGDLQKLVGVRQRS
jgi:hypothetical protein